MTAGSVGTIEERLLGLPIRLVPADGANDRGTYLIMLWDGHAWGPVDAVPRTREDAERRAEWLADVLKTYAAGAS